MAAVLVPSFKIELLNETPYLVLCAQAFDCWQNIVQFDLRHFVERTLTPLCFLHSVPDVNFCSSLCRSWLISLLHLLLRP